MTWWTTVVNSVWHHTDDGEVSACGQPVPRHAVDRADDVAQVFSFRPWTAADGDDWSIEVDGSRFVRDDTRTPQGKRQCHHCWMALRKVSA